MKKKLLAIGLMSLFVDNTYASDLRDMIAKNPVVFAAVGYALGTIGYKLCTVHWRPALTFRIYEGSSDQCYISIEKLSGEVISHDYSAYDAYARGYDFLGISAFELKHDIKVDIWAKNQKKEQKMIERRTDATLEEIKSFNARFIPQASTSRSWILDEATNHKAIIVADHKAIFAGIAAGAVCGGVALWATKK